MTTGVEAISDSAAVIERASSLASEDNPPQRPNADRTRVSATIQHQWRPPQHTHEAPAPLRSASPNNSDPHERLAGAARRRRRNVRRLRDIITWLLLAGRQQDARALAGFIADCLILLRRLLGDRRVSCRSKLLLSALIGYLALPIDLIPDFIPIAGQLDDALIVAFVLRSILRISGPDLLCEHWPGPPGSMSALLRLAYATPNSS
jgi:uncharacterized membrane protein YkvA (DUF1232 family)